MQCRLTLNATQVALGRPTLVAGMRIRPEVEEIPPFKRDQENGLVVLRSGLLHRIDLQSQAPL